MTTPSAPPALTHTAADWRNLAPAETLLWRCGGPCVIKPILGEYAVTGGLHVRLSMRRPRATRRGNGEERDRFCHYYFDLRLGPVVAHCFVCHSFREILMDPATGAIIERARQGYIPRIDCICTQQEGKGE